MLAAREGRQRRQRELIAASGNPVLSITMVAPGTVKSSLAIERRFAVAAATVGVELAGWTVTGRSETHGPTGPELLLSVAVRPEVLKRWAVGLENTHPWGRLWDLDVVTAAGPMSRATVGESPRRCVICEADAAGCVRSARHRLADVEGAIARLQACAPPPARLEPPELWTPAVLGAVAAEALRVEARLCPKPGLVDADNNGAHTDMSLGLLLASADAIEPCLKQMAEVGAQQDVQVEELVRLGMQAEQRMLAATDGVNAHKGAIFVIGWLVSVLAAARVIRSPDLKRRITDLAGPVVAPWFAEVKAADETHGRRAWRQHNLPGARGEVSSGLASVWDCGLPAYQKALHAGFDPDAALLSALVALMGRVDDTTLVARGGIRALRTVQRWAQGLQVEARTPEALQAALARANAPFVARTWSPGGSADLVSATWLAHVAGV